MDDLKLFAKNEDQIDNLVNAVRVCSEDIKMEFGLPKYGVLIMKRGKVVKSEGISMPDGKMKSKLNRGNIILAINSRSISIASYGAGIISWTKMELEKLDRRTRKLMTIYGAHHPKADVGRLYLQRCEGGRGLLGLEDCGQVEVHSLDKYLSTSKEKILKEVSRSRIIENNKCGRSKEEVHKEHQEKYEGKPLHGQFRKATEEVGRKTSWDWLKKGYLKKETESTIVAAQDQALCTRNLRNAKNVKSICRVCGAADETVVHIVSDCSKIAQKEYKQVNMT